MLSDLYTPTPGPRQSEVARVRTVAGTLFLPLSFLKGLYVTEFDVMPELTRARAASGWWV